MKNSANEIKSEIASQINYLQNKINDLEKKLNEDFLQHFAWVSEDLFHHKFQVQELKFKYDFLNDINSDLSEIEECKIIIKGYEQYLDSDFNVRSNSSGTLHRETSTWKYQSILELKKFFVNLIK
jgi:hypothetical protein